MKASTCTMPASDTRQAMRGSTEARITPTAPPMLWPAYAILPTPHSTSASMTLPRSPTSLLGTASSKRPSEPAVAGKRHAQGCQPRLRQRVGKRHEQRPVLVRGHAVRDDDDGIRRGRAPWRRLIGDVEPLALRVSDDVQRRAHRRSTSAIRRSTASSTKAGSSAWAARSTISMLAGTCAFSSAKKIASSAGSFRGPPGIA